MNISQEKNYNIFPTMEHSLLFGIGVRATPVDSPKLIYNGGDHALLYRSEEEVIILDYLHPQAKLTMQQISDCYISEIDYDTGEVTRAYPVRINQVTKMPFNIEQTLQSLRQR